MNVLLLGGQGMAGHLLAAYWLMSTDHRLTVTVRPGSANSDGNRLPRHPRVEVKELDVRDLRMVEETVRRTSPNLILNAAGMLNLYAEERPRHAYLINGLLPHWLAYLADRQGARLMHISSDCVFTGDRGGYLEDDTPDGRTVYARTKALGEVRDPRHLTIRTSIIGPDARRGGIGLMKWFLSQRGEVKGYRQVLWNGVTTLELAKATVWLAERPGIGELIHLALRSR